MILNEICAKERRAISVVCFRFSWRASEGGAMVPFRKVHERTHTHLHTL